MNLFKLLTSLATWWGLRTFINRPFLVSLSRSDTCLLQQPIPGLWMLEVLALIEEVDPLRYRITVAGIRALGPTVAEREERLRQAKRDDGLFTFVAVGQGGVS